MFFDLTAAGLGVHAQGVPGRSLARSRRPRFASATALLSLVLLWSAVSTPAIAQSTASEFDGRFAPMALPPSPLYPILMRACPDARIQSTELDAVRVVESKLAVAAAMRAAAQRDRRPNVPYGAPGPDGTYHFASTPREVATVFRQTLGPSSLLTRSVDAVAFVTDTVEYTTQVPLDGLNEVADLLVDQAHRAGLRNLPQFRFRSRIENDRAGVTFSARW